MLFECLTLLLPSPSTPPQLYTRRRFFYPPSRKESYFSLVVEHVRAETQVSRKGKVWLALVELAEANLLSGHDYPAACPRRPGCLMQPAGAAAPAAAGQRLPHRY